MFPTRRSSAPQTPGDHHAKDLAGSFADLIRYDEDHGSDMTKTLDTFLRCRRSWQRTAAELHIHRQTVVYRIRRVEEITGRTLIESADISELWLALRARELTAVRS